MHMGSVSDLGLSYYVLCARNMLTYLYPFLLMSQHLLATIRLAAGLLKI